MDKIDFVNKMVSVRNKIYDLQKEKRDLIETLCADFDIDSSELEDIEVDGAPNTKIVSEAIECYIDYGEGDRYLLKQIYKRIAQYANKGSDQR